MFASHFARAVSACAAAAILFACGQSSDEPPAQPKPKANKSKKADKDEAAPPEATADMSATPAKPTKSGKKKPPQQPVEEPKPAERPIVAVEPSIEHGELFGYLPKDAWLTIRLPDVARARAAFQTTALFAAFEKSGMAGTIRSFLDPVEAQGRQWLKQHAAAILPFAEKVIENGNEFVISLLYVDLERAESGSELPFYAVAFADLKGKDSEIRDAVRALETVLQATMSAEELSGDGFRVHSEGMRIEVAIRSARLGVLVAPDSSSQPSIDDLFDLRTGESLLAADVVTRSPRTPPGEVAYAQAFVNFSPLVRLARGYAPKDEQPIFDTLGFDTLAGISAELSIAGSDLHDTFTLVSPGRRDIFTDGLISKGFDPKFARHTFSDADDAGISSVDLEGFVDAIRKRLPAEGKRTMSERFAQMKIDTGIDLQQDILKTFGPNIAYSTRGSPALAETGLGEVAFALACQVNNAEAAKRVVTALVSSGLPATALRDEGMDYWRIDVPELLAHGLGKPVFAVMDDALLIASDFASLNALRAIPKDAPVSNPRLAALVGKPSAEWVGCSSATALSEIATLLTFWQQVVDEAILAGASPEIELPSIEKCQDFVAGMSDSTRVWRATDDTVVFDCRGPLGSPMMLLAPLSIVAAVALPQLVAAREGGSGAAGQAEGAVMMLAQIALAQSQFQQIRAVDQDNDKVGEYGTFAELTGKAPVGNGKKYVNPPLVAPVFSSVRDGVATVDGYCYRVVFLGSNGVAVGELGNGGRPEAVDVDSAERQFVVYAWPEKVTHGGRAFMTDQQGRVWEMISADGKMPYAGTDRPLPLDSGFGSVEPASATTGERRGPRGELWRLVP